MDRTHTLLSSKTFSETCQYLQAEFFPGLKDLGPKIPKQNQNEEENVPPEDLPAPLALVGRDLLPQPPRILVSDAARFEMMKVLGRRFTVRVEVEEDKAGKVMVTVISEVSGFQTNIIGGSILTVLTCGLAALFFGPALYVKYRQWNQLSEKIFAALEAGIAAS